jgi:hypothetical protein
MEFKFKFLLLLLLQMGVLPYGEAVVSIANTVMALCLNNGGLVMVQNSRLLDSFINIFTSKK